MIKSKTARMANGIKTLRTNLGWSQEELARRVGTSNQMISLLERGRRRLTVEWLDRLAGALGCMPTDIFRPPSWPTALRRQPLDVPVRGTAAGGASGAF
ncbi:MAG: helix-turn-helix transcriptional regulator [Rhodospirillaceae bacterium]